MRSQLRFNVIHLLENDLCTPDKYGNGGTYALILKSESCRYINVGKLGRLQLAEGFYIYIGSAFGPGGLGARIRHHLNASRSHHWHVDYLKSSVRVLEIWLSCDPIKREHFWADCISQLPTSSIPLAGFGASDCKCKSHLFFLYAEPDFEAFQHRVCNTLPVHQSIFRVSPTQLS